MSVSFRKTESKNPINPRFRAYGKARIDIAKRAETREDWDQLWVKPTNPFPFAWGNSWKQCIEYKVADFPAEVGFFIDILGFPVNAFDPDYAMFTSPSGDFYFSVVPTREGENPTPLGAIRLQFMVQNIVETAIELERRGVKFNQLPARVADNSSFLIGSFFSPNGIGIELWGFDSRNEFTAPDPKKEITARARKISEQVEGEKVVPAVVKDEKLVEPPASQHPGLDQHQVYEANYQKPGDEIEYLDGDEY